MKTTIHNSWVRLMNPLRGSSPLHSKLLEDTSYFPKGNQVFEAFSFPVEDLKIVILGRGPLRDSQGTSGIAYTFNDCKLNQSLENLLYGLIMESDAKNLQNNTIDIKSWTDKGILMLNTSLTTQTGREEIHREYWYNFMGNLIKSISIQQPAIWFVFGEDLYDYSKFIFKKVTASDYSDDTIGNIPKTGSMNYVFYDKNPLVQMGRINKNFKKASHFSYSNEILKGLNKDQIKW